MIRVAAVGDVHYSEDSKERFSRDWSKLHEKADVFLLAGDLTTQGRVEQVKVLIEDLREVKIPIIAILGNHDYHSDQNEAIRRELERNHITVLEGESIVLSINDETLGIAGTIGFGGGFIGACAHKFGEPEMKAFVRHTEILSARLADALGKLQTDHRVALVHYSPVEATLKGERLEIYPFLGSYLLAQAIDETGADLVIHGHAHHGEEKGATSRGTPVRNVAFPVIKCPFAIYQLEKGNVKR